ncbi:MAG: ABC transporter permease [Pirellulaceae bacterium]|jgi:putative ABC transport system permease protein
MRDALYLAWRYLAFHLGTSVALCAALTIVMFVPMSIQWLIADAAETLHARARSTPLVLGQQGSSLDLTLHALYFESTVPDTVSYADARDVTETSLARAIPLMVSYRARKAPVVGTTVDYLDFRSLRLAAGRRFHSLGECVIGNEVARRLQLGVGDTILSTPENVFDIAGAYALRMKIVGVLERSSQADDRVVFCDIKTTWVIAGLGHGHDDVENIEQSRLLSHDGSTVTASAAVQQYNEITPDNLDQFHFHGDTSSFPLTAALVIPRDTKSETLLLGRYDNMPLLHLARPNRVIDDLLQTVARVRTYVVAVSILLGATTVLLIGVLFVLIWRLRATELRTMRLLGASRQQIVMILGSEATIVFALSFTVATGAAYLVGQFGESVIWWWM